MLEAYLKTLELGWFEVSEAFKGLADENVWKRPALGLLSVGELAGHVAHWEAVRLAGDGMQNPDLEQSKVKSILIDSRFRYYPTTISTPPSEEHLTMTAEQVYKEIVRVHQESVAHFTALNPDLESAPPGVEGHWTYGEFLKYLIFHVSYHTGQMYSVRHLLGEETPDN